MADIFGNMLPDQYQAIADERRRQIDASKWARLHDQLRAVDDRTVADPTSSAASARAAQQPATEPG